MTCVWVKTLASGSVVSTVVELTFIVIILMCFRRRNIQEASHTPVLHSLALSSALVLARPLPKFYVIADKNFEGMPGRLK